ncbi:hypothetical protein PK35_01850 [Tamlana nanhaiensis]|uniref:Uncharacterized protein n=1 Tax=Neotamlana nanhaiensis TaxID=1382798 RepID=A0A0D7W9W8_9FLAO|nr:hypothetical protein [Tamlana nanhaiensis]KJD34552.1 hypothetical protein PK35_01850 [Tamlana nanhaiensis]
MKKLAYLILGLIIGAVLTYYFCPKQCVVGGPENMMAKAPKDTISIAEATQLSANWGKYNKTEIDTLLELEGSRKKTQSVWWSIDDINQYIVYAKSGADSLGYSFTGLRVYLGNYGKEALPPKRYRNTMFIVPTGNPSKSKASSLNFILPPDDGDIPLPPLNDGGTGQGGYPPK